MTTTDSGGGISARSLLFALYGSLLLLTLSVAVWLLVNSGDTIVSDVIRQAATSSQKAVTREVERFLESGESVNRQLSLAVSASRIDTTDTAALRRLIRDAERVSEAGSVSSIYIGLSDGRFYGLSAQPETWPTLFWMHTQSSPKTQGRLVYHSDTNDGESGPAIKTFGVYDPRIRPWYSAAMDSDKSSRNNSIWTDVYSSFGVPVSTITRAVTVRAEDGRVLGVAGTDLFIPHLQRFLATLDLSDNSEVFILDGDGAPLAVWGPAAGAIDIRNSPEMPLEKLRFAQLALDMVNDASGNSRGELAEREPALHQSEQVALGLNEPGSPASARPMHGYRDIKATGVTTLDGAEGYLSVATLSKPNTPPWRIGVFVPSSDYLKTVGEQMLFVVPLGLLLIVFSLLTIGGFAILVSRPLERLCESAAQIAQGRFTEAIPVPVGREVGVLARSIDNMRHSLRQSFRALSEERQRATATLQSIEDGVIVIDEQDRVVLLNRAAQRFIGCDEKTAISLSIEEVLTVRNARSGQRLSAADLRSQLASTRRDGLEIILTSDIGVELSARLLITPLNDGLDSRGAVLTLHDMTMARQLQAELAWGASHDALTELVNRRELVARITRAIDNAQDMQIPSALAVFDLTGFSEVNNEIGYGGGDELLRQVAARLLSLVDDQQHVTVARTDGDEFVVLVEGRNVDMSGSLFESMRDDIARFQFNWIDRGFSIAAAVGALNITDDTVSAAAALRDAGTACMKSRQEGSFRVQVCDLTEDMHTTLDLDRERINAAMNEGRFELAAQHVVSLKEDKPPNVELLLRLRGETGELMSPSTFLPAAERLGIASRLDRHVIELAFAALVERSPAARGIGSCAINLSGQTLGDPTFLPWILDALVRYPIDPQALVFEVTETATVVHLSVARRLMNTLKERGISFSLDDFGTGMCSFAYLKELPINGLKIDGSFITNMVGEWQSEALVRSMVELAKSLQLKTVAECIENEATLEALKAMGVDSAQGFYLHSPEPF